MGNLPPEYYKDKALKEATNEANRTDIDRFSREIVIGQNRKPVTTIDYIVLLGRLDKSFQKPFREHKTRIDGFPRKSEE